MKNVSDSLAGRAGVIKLPGLSMRELAGISYRTPFKPTSEHFSEVAKEHPGYDPGKLCCI